LVELKRKNSKLICPICLKRMGLKKAYRFLRGKKSMFKNEKEFFNHVENEHGQVVVREGETEEEAKERCRKKGIYQDPQKCQCADCKRKRGER